MSQEIYDLLLTGDQERTSFVALALSQLLKRLLEEHFNPVDPEDRITQLERRQGRWSGGWGMGKG